MGDTLNNKTRYLRIKSGKDWTVDENEKISFLNFSSITTYFENSDLDRVEYYCDGSLSSVVVGVLSRTKINRFSFDFTSMADPVLNHAELEVIITKESTDIKILATLMLEKDISALPFIDQNDKVSGIITKTDILDYLVHALPFQTYV